MDAKRPVVVLAPGKPKNELPGCGAVVDPNKLLEPNALGWVVD